MDSTIQDPEKANQTTSDPTRPTGFWDILLRPFRGRRSEAVSAQDNATPGIATGGAAADPAIHKSAPTPLANAAGSGPEKKPDKPEDVKKDGYTKAENDAACTKLLNIYVGEAERYDKAVVESWKNDMTGLLIFSGLFSASLTAFIIESYKTLQQDPADTTNDLLKQMISLQPASTIPVYEAPPPFEVTTAALACNILWFISLALSLTCSLLATLVDQWAREFLHKTDIRPAPVIRARVLSFLYRGLQDFHMHAVVDTMPFLLHFSLFLFFGGLIPFLLPINVAVAVIVAVILGTFLGLYILLTVLPVVRRACPYRTPLSSVAWKVSRSMSTGVAIFRERFKGVRLVKHQKSHEQPDLSESDALSRSMTDVALDEASTDSHVRDVHAVKWTLKSLTDDSELLPFIEAIPELVCGHKGFRRDNDHLLLPLLNTSDPQASISTRVVDLLRRSDNYPQEAIPGTLSRERIQTACLKAIWALGMLPNPMPFGMHVLWFDSGVLGLLNSSTLDAHYTLTAHAAVLYSWKNYILACVTEMHRVQNELDVAQAGRQLSPVTLYTINNMVACLQTLKDVAHGKLASLIVECARRVIDHLSKVSTELTRAGADRAAENSTLLIALTSKATEFLTTFRDEMILVILVKLLTDSLARESCPYEFSATCQKLVSDHAPSYNLGPYWNNLFYGVIPDPSSVASLSSDIHDLDHIMMVILQSLSLSGRQSSIYTPEIYRYIAKRKSDRAILHIMKECDIAQLQSVITRELTYYYSGDELLETICILCRFMREDKYPFKKADLHGWVNDLYPRLLKQSRTSMLSEMPVTMAIVSHDILCVLVEEMAEGIPYWIHPPMSIDNIHASAILHKVHDHPLLVAHLPGRATLDLSLGDPRSVLQAKGKLLDELHEIQISLISQLLSTYSTERTPDNGPEAMKILCMELWRYKHRVRPEIQRAFANGVQNIMQCLLARPNDTLLQKILAEVCQNTSEWECIDDVISAWILAEVALYYLKLDRAPEDPGILGHNFLSCQTHGAVKTAQPLLAHCLKILNAAGQDAVEELESKLRKDSMLSNFIRPAFP